MQAPFRSTVSIAQIGRQRAAVGGDAAHHLLVQPDVPRGRAGLVIAVVEELGRQLLARGQAAVQAQEL